MPGDIVEVGSPSHAIRYRDENDSRRVSLAPEADVPNRDLVIDIRIGTHPASFLGPPRTGEMRSARRPPETGGGGVYPSPPPPLPSRERGAGATLPLVLAGEKHFAVAIPSTRFGQVEAGARKVALVIDRSGSMQGQPMTQARRAVEACLGALGQDDEFAIVAFDTVADVFRPSLTKASTDGRDAARVFMQTVDARGGTELAMGFAEGARLVAGGGDVLVVTDGQVMGTEDIIAKARSLGVRIHCLGIGSASQDRFLAQLASSTGGVSRFVSADERVDVAAVDLFASIGRPVASGITVSGARCPVEPPSAVFGGTPWVAFGEVAESRKLILRWTDDGSLEIDLPASESEVAETIRLLHGARQIAEVESRMTAANEKELDGRLAALSTEFSLASRAMALVTVVKREADVAGAPPVIQVVPLGMPLGTAFDAYFGAPASAPAQAAPSGYARMAAYAAAPSPAMEPQQARSSLHVPRLRAKDLRGSANRPSGTEQAETSPLSRLRNIFRGKPATADPPESTDLTESAELDDTDRLLAIASTLAPDGGVPGSLAPNNGGTGSDSTDDRVLKTISAVLFFLLEGHTPTAGAFRAHVERMVRFLETISTPHRAVVDRVVAFARAGKKPRTPKVDAWSEVDAAIA